VLPQQCRHALPGHAEDLGDLVHGHALVIEGFGFSVPESAARVGQGLERLRYQFDGLQAPAKRHELLVRQPAHGTQMHQQTTVEQRAEPSAQLIRCCDEFNQACNSLVCLVRPTPLHPH